MREFSGLLVVVIWGWGGVESEVVVGVRGVVFWVLSFCCYLERGLEVFRFCFGMVLDFRFGFLGFGKFFFVNFLFR